MAEAILRFDNAQFARAQRLLFAVRGGVELAGKKAINDTLRFIRASAVRKIRKRLALKAKDIRERIKLTRATRATARGEMRIVGGRRLPLFLFGAKQRKKGVSYKIKPGGKRKVIPGAFIHEGRSYVFVREFGDAAETGREFGRRVSIEDVDLAGRKRVGRRPIRPVFGPSVGFVFEQEIQATIELEAAQKLEERFEFHVDDLLRKAGL